MEWQEVIPDTASSYNGIHVGFRSIAYTKHVARMFTELGWKFIKIEYLPDTGLIRFTKSEKSYGHRIGTTNITSKLGKLVTNGRYTCQQYESELIFTKI